jgi:hypothetical protein
MGEKKRILLMTVIAFAGILLVCVTTRGPTTAEIRLDTGDLRYCWWGIPLKYEMMPEPSRSKLLTVASRTPSIPAKWVTCVSKPWTRTTLRTHRTSVHFYHCIAIWSDEDQKIASWAMEDVVYWINGMTTHGGSLKCSSVLSGFVVDVNKGTIDPRWREMDAVRYYCDVHGYTPLPASTTGGK